MLSIKFETSFSDPEISFSSQWFSYFSFHFLILSLRKIKFLFFIFIFWLGKINDGVSCWEPRNKLCQKIQNYIKFSLNLPRKFSKFFQFSPENNWKEFKLFFPVANPFISLVQSSIYFLIIRNKYFIFVTSKMIAKYNVIMCRIFFIFSGKSIFHFSLYIIKRKWDGKFIGVSCLKLSELNWREWLVGWHGKSGCYISNKFLVCLKSPDLENPDNHLTFLKISFGSGANVTYLRGICIRRNEIIRSDQVFTDRVTN